jgi:tetratricopeptide (TPR) repeat protein
MDSRPPRAVADLVLTAVPDLRDRLLEHRIRRAWPQLVGADAARRAQAKSFADGCLTVAVDNSPWLHELTLRSDELTRRLKERFDAVRSLRFVSGAVDAGASARSAAKPAAPLDQRALREIEQATAVIPDAAVASAARRLLMKAWPGLTVIVAGTALVGCASMGQPTISGDDEISRRVVANDPRGEAYYAYTIAQMNVQAGRFKDAVPYMRTAIKRDPNSASLWTQLAQLLLRADNVEDAVVAARRAVELAPDQVSTHMTLAELLRTQRKIPEAEAELERAIALSPSSEEPYLTLARIYVEQKAYDKARAVLLRLVEQQPRLAQAQFLLGRLAIETENWDEAIARLTAAVELDPDHDGAWSALGAVYGEALHKNEEAIAVYRRAVKANPDNPAFADKLADLLIRLGRLPEAQTELEGDRRSHSPEPPRLDEARRRLLRAEDVGQGHRGLPARGGARARELSRPLLPGHHVHGRGAGRRGQGRARAHPESRPALHRRASPAGVPLRPRQAV